MSSADEELIAANRRLRRTVRRQQELIATHERRLDRLERSGP